MFIETSAKLGHNVTPLFKRIARALPGMDEGAPQDGTQMIDININSNPPQENQGCSC